jgi:hypothetical protein
MPHPQFDEAMIPFLAGAEAKIAEYIAQYQHIERSWLEVETGRRYAKVVVYSKDRGREGGRDHTYCFVDMDSGNILKAGGPSGPQDQHPRGNIFAPDHGVSGVNWYGAVYADELVPEYRAEMDAHPERGHR